MKLGYIYKLLFLIIILFSSCISTKKLIRNSTTEISEFDKNNLDGIYSNINKQAENNSLWFILTKTITQKFNQTSIENYNVKITLSNDKTLNIKLVKQDSILEEYNLPGKIKNQYFSVDKDLKLIPFYPIYYIRNEQKTIVGNDKDGNLVLVNGFESEGAILFLGNGNNGIYEYKFEKIKN
ncbi:hypothetical protein CJ739_2545 [Mariniflexile rhizosphaerae]|uniref:hypothetical protein n=1 Tax=unclassified Mariniflexile TaxID=2643887 RepID=UPI000E33082E|nr:hypothetical protein [Mariniflexile sp. TRM1-10]AXP81618.1 hypothetical protein CJ739_2545 [Mariniflexile sp. TRM1-10]